MGLPIAVQMYTLRDYLKSPFDFVRTIKKIRDIGYTAVQISGAACMNGDKPSLSAKEAKKILDDNGVACVATHKSWDGYLNQIEKEIEFHHELGCNYTAAGSLPDTFGSQVGAYEQFLEYSKPIIKKFGEAGIKFGYHNHAHEFEKYNKESTFYDILVDAPNKDLQLEIDVHWAWRGGVDPAKLLKRAAGRVPVIHVKDYTIVNKEVQFAAIGEGNLNWDEILTVGLKSGVEWFIVEQDVCPRNPFDCLKSSFEYLSYKLN